MTLTEKYERFIDLKGSGMKPQARLLADEIIQDYRNEANMEFVYEICDRCEHKIDFFIWNEIVFPELRTRIDDEPAAVKATIQTMQNLYQSKNDWKSVGYVTEYELLSRYLKMCPEDQWALTKRVEQLRSWLAYTIHEWPWGVLYGPDSASEVECQEIYDAIDELKSLDSESAHNALCQDVRQKTELFASWLGMEADERGTWEEYCAANPLN